MIAGIEDTSVLLNWSINDKLSSNNKAFPFPTQTFGIAENFSDGFRIAHARFISGIYYFEQQTLPSIASILLMDYVG